MAEIAAEAAVAALRETEADQMRARPAEMDAKRQERGARHQRVDQRPEDATDLALIAADAEALTALLRGKDDSAAARATAEQKTRELDASRHAKAGSPRTAGAAKDARAGTLRTPRNAARRQEQGASDAKGRATGRQGEHCASVGDDKKSALGR